MKTRSIIGLLLGIAFVACTREGRAAERTIFDIVVPDKRKAVVEMAEQLAGVRPLPALPAGNINPFDPPGFGQPDQDELAAARAAQKSQANRPLSDRELLETIAGQLAPTGTMMAPGREPILIFGKKSVKIGTRFQVNYSGVDYNLELTAIDRTTFTLRFNREEIIRPIKPGK